MEKAHGWESTNRGYLRPADQSPAYGVQMDVFYGVQIVLNRAQGMVKETALPELAGRSSNKLDGNRGSDFDGFHDLGNRERMARKDGGVPAVREDTQAVSRKPCLAREERKIPGPLDDRSVRRWVPPNVLYLPALRPTDLRPVQGQKPLNL